jgi:hypothetical protein
MNIKFYLHEQSKDSLTNSQYIYVVRPAALVYHGRWLLSCLRPHGPSLSLVRLVTCIALLICVYKLVLYAPK